MILQPSTGSRPWSVPNSQKLGSQFTFNFPWIPFLASCIPSNNHESSCSGCSLSFTLRDLLTDRRQPIPSQLQTDPCEVFSTFVRSHRLQVPILRCASQISASPQQQVILTRSGYDDTQYRLLPMWSVRIVFITTATHTLSRDYEPLDILFPAT